MISKPNFRGGFALAGTVRDLYAEGQVDYSLEPIVCVDEKGAPIGRIQDGDAVIFCCRRGEREIQLTDAFVDPSLDQFPRETFHSLEFVTLTLYHDKFKDLPVAFAPERVTGSLGEAVSRAGLRQLRAAESEKFAHITFFLNGGNPPFAGETDVRIPSPRGIPFDQVPELSLEEVASSVIEGIEQHYEFIATNFANGDVIGHTANGDAKIRCAEFIDAQLGRVLQAAIKEDYVVFITADHGNLEVMRSPDGSPHVAHTSNTVPCILIDPAAQSQDASAAPVLHDGILADLAPTILNALGITPPPIMTGSDLVQDAAWGGRRRVLLIILDGWGTGREDDTNPIFLASTPVWDDLLRRYPCAQLQASGSAVGLQSNKAGNSEAGHMNIGAGRIVVQDDVRLDMAMQDGSFYTNEILCRTVENAYVQNTPLHLIGLLSEKSSHGSIDYPLSLLRMAKNSGLEQVYLHIIFDGRSTQPGSAPAMLEKLQAQMEAIGIGQVVTGVGRGIALDRDGNYAKTRLAYDALVYGSGRACAVVS